MTSFKVSKFTMALLIPRPWNVPALRFNTIPMRWRSRYGSEACGLVGSIDRCTEENGEARGRNLAVAFRRTWGTSPGLRLGLRSQGMIYRLRSSTIFDTSPSDD